MINKKTIKKKTFAKKVKHQVAEEIEINMLR